jgi:hypothetical protein
MPNLIKYATTGDTQSLKKGNFYFGVGDVPKGPTSTTNYWNGITPPVSGYTIYINKASNGPSIYVASNDTQLINYTKGFSGQNFTGATECLNWYSTQTEYACVNIDYESIITSGLTFCFDAGFTPSYSRSGNTWYDLAYSGYNGTLTNGPMYNGDSGGAIVFDGVDDYVVRNSSINTGQDFSVFAWIKPGTINVRNGIVGNSYPYSSGSGWLFSTATNYNGNLNTFFISIGSDNAYRIASNNSITLNSWNYIGGTVTNGGQNIKLYSNGVETGYTAGSLVTNTVNYSTQEFYVGRRYSANPEPFNGSISIVQIYNRVLSASEILQNYNAQKSRYVASFDPDAQAFITAANITNSTQQTAINDLVVGLKADGLWANMYAIYPFVGGTLFNHKWNLKDPRDLDAAYRLNFYGGWVSSSNGITANGVNTYADTYFDGGVGAIGCYNRNTNFAMGTEFQTWEGEDYPVFQTPYIYIIGSNQGTIQNTENFNYVVFPGSALPFTHITFDTQQRLYGNGNLVNSNAFYFSPPSPPTGYPIWLGGINGNGRYSNPYFGSGTSSFSFISNVLNSTQSANLYNRIQTYQTALNRQV